MKKYLMVLIMLTKLQAAHASPFESAKSTADVASLLSNLPEGSTVFVDIDDTVITPHSKTFRAPPYNQLIDHIKKNKDSYPNYEQIVSNWRLQRKIMLIDPEWPSVLSQLKERFLVYGLTKMDTGKFGNIESMESWRYQELRSVNIEFSENISIPEDHIKGASFYKGLFITGNNSKSQTIAYFLSYLKTHTIVLIDDREEHLQDLAQFCNRNSIKFIGILFDGLEKFQDKPDPDVALFQRQYLIKNAQWLEDDKAEQIMLQSNVLGRSKL